MQVEFNEHDCVHSRVRTVLPSEQSCLLFLSAWNQLHFALVPLDRPNVATGIVCCIRCQLYACSIYDHAVPACTQLAGHAY